MILVKTNVSFSTFLKVFVIFVVKYGVLVSLKVILMNFPMIVFMVSFIFVSEFLLKVVPLFILMVVYCVVMKVIFAFVDVFRFYCWVRMFILFISSAVVFKLFSSFNFLTSSFFSLSVGPIPFVQISWSFSV